jgi:hypothetical protein
MKERLPQVINVLQVGLDLVHLGFQVSGTGREFGRRESERVLKVVLQSLCFTVVLVEVMTLYAEFL